jgi:hypothetical protein
MKTIHARSLAPSVIDWLATARHPRVLHVFDHACNLIDENRDVISIVNPRIGNGPFSIVVDPELFFPEHVDAQTPISVEANQISLGDLLISTDHATQWNPRPNWERLHANKENISNLSIQLPITNYQSLIFDLTSSLTHANLPTAKQTASKLAGLGPGLTPSGDDILMGAMYAAWIIHPPEVTSMLGSEVAETASALTSSLSAAWLKSAGRGEAGSLWHQFFDAMLTGENIQSKIKNILAVGHTSGADALTGFMSVLTCWNESTNKETAVL